MKSTISALTLLLSMLFAVTSACSLIKTNTNTPAPITNTITAANTTAEPAGTPASAAAESQSAAAAALVADLYKQHDAHKSPFFQTKNRSLVDKYFTKSTADLI